MRPHCGSCLNSGGGGSRYRLCPLDVTLTAGGDRTELTEAHPRVSELLVEQEERESWGDSHGTGSGINTIRFQAEDKKHHRMVLTTLKMELHMHRE